MFEVVVYQQKEPRLARLLYLCFSRFYLIFNITPLLAGICSVNFSLAQSFWLHCLSLSRSLQVYFFSFRRRYSMACADMFIAVSAFWSPKFTATSSVSLPSSDWGAEVKLYGVESADWTINLLKQREKEMLSRRRTG